MRLPALSILLGLLAAGHGGATSAASRELPPARAVPTRAESTPHRSAFITHHGVRLHYLDWGWSSLME